MPKPVCVPCQRFLRPLKNGAYALENKPIVDHPVSGTSAPDHWVPYKVWQCDTWRCEGCGVVVAVGFANRPLWEDYRGPLPDGQYLPINDC
jgi:hypothetical protein